MKFYQDSFLKFYPIFDWILEVDLPEMKVRLSIFIITGVCAGLPALVWSVRDLIHHRKNGHRISVFIILLLITDFAELLLSTYILIKFFLNDIVFNLDQTFRVFWALLWASRDCGLLLNQLVALEGILSVKYPLYMASVFSSPCFIIFYILVFLCIFINNILNLLHRIINGLLMFIVSVILWIIFYRAVYSAADRHSHTSRKPDHHILFVFILTLLMLYLPDILPFLPVPTWHISFCLKSVRLISDPLLCVLVCRQNLRIQTSQNREGTSLVTSEM